MTYQEVLRTGEDTLAGHVPEAKLNAWYLFSHCFRMEKSQFFLRGQENAPAVEQRQYRKALEERVQRIPLEYITHETEFMGLSFYVDENVLIPRQDTECMVEYVLNFSEGGDVLDLCTGSGCIGISLAVLGKCSSVVLSDISEKALAVAERNAGANGADVRLIHSDLFRNIEGMFDLIVSNPPYIPTGDMEGLMPEVRDHEPALALDGSPDGLRFYREIIRDAGKFLRDGGRLCLEIGYDQGQSVKALMETKFEQVEIRKDLAGLDRIVTGIRRETRRRQKIGIKE